jgi:hypothetical protein
LPFAASSSWRMSTVLATGIADEVAPLCVETVGPAGSVKQALELMEHGGRLDAAVLDINPRGAPGSPRPSHQS